MATANPAVDKKATPNLIKPPLGKLRLGFAEPAPLLFHRFKTAITCLYFIVYKQLSIALLSLSAITCLYFITYRQLSIALSSLSEGITMRTFGETGITGVDGGRAVAAAPFVLKTYRMVDDPSTDLVIAWGRENNSFVVVDPFAFSRTLLPAHFKHSNFSSFVRQLNTYGFRKVDPDRWEFAHSSFMRGKTHLLGQVVRRNGCVVGGRKRREEEEMDEAVAAEVARLKQEQSAIEDRVEKMWRRLQETERRPRQMLAFLLRVVGDPEMLKRLMARAGVEEGGKKRARLCIADRRFGEGEKAAATAAAAAVASVAVDGTCCRGEGFMPAIDVAATETAVAEGGVDLGVGGALGSAIGDGMGGVFGSYFVSLSSLDSHLPYYTRVCGVCGNGGESWLFERPVFCFSSGLVGKNCGGRSGREDEGIAVVGWNRTAVSTGIGRQKQENGLQGGTAKGGAERSSSFGAGDSFIGVWREKVTKRYSYGKGSEHRL
ncbi:hypothetical protein HPP92_021399 [Vanilla planifolia]|uniref:HSF-type DNA-binding domain-containing protein n=1 Tax=Vanilla planifolia TaxID=51239 RepID=A0A835UIR0_VANPL|nr:hypothetical protein HPP92_021399 [Vanilla planifolia]